MSFWGILGLAAADTAIEGAENQITFENFVIQAKKQSLLSAKPDCVGKTPNADDYLTLYDALVAAKVILRNATKGSIWTWSFSYTISTSVSLNANNLKSVLENTRSPEYSDITKCFVVDFGKLSHLLKTYKYEPTDQISAFKEAAVGGRRKTQKQYPQSCRKKHNSKSKSNKRNK